MKNRKLLLCILLLTSGCQEIFEKDLSGKDVNLIAPADSIRTYREDVTFAWTELEGATGYRLIIASPSFATAELYVLDTLIAGHRYTYRLQPGRYQWAVRPENQAYEGAYRGHILTVLTKKQTAKP